jgi:hypothetical protein
MNAHMNMHVMFTKRNVVEDGGQLSSTIRPQDHHPGKIGVSSVIKIKIKCDHGILCVFVGPTPSPTTHTRKSVWSQGRMFQEEGVMLTKQYF